jgi:glycine oxidase
MSGNSADILIIGGGVIGLTTAYFLSREGADVLLLDQGDLGREASWAGAGILPPSSVEHARTPFDRLRAKSVAMFPALSAELRERTGIDNGYCRCGGLEFVGAGGAAEEEWHGEGVVCERVRAAELPRLEPNVATDQGDAWHLPELAQVRNPRHLKGLIAACGPSAGLLPHCPVYRLETTGDRVTGVRTANGVYHAARVLVAAGAWSGALLEPTGWRPSIRPIRGQIALLQTPASPVRRVLMWGASYLVPRPDGRVLVGSTEEDVGFCKHTTAEAIQRLLALACRLVPCLADAAVACTWAGLRPGSPDGLPFLGSVPGWQNLFVASGHFRSGIQLSPATGLVMKELLLGQPASIDLKPFALDRLAATRSAAEREQQQPHMTS